MVKICRAGDKIIVVSPFNYKFIAQARRLGGEWSRSKRVWVFPVNRERAVRQLCRRVYLTDGTEPTATIRVTLPPGDYGRIVALPGGHTVLERMYRDSPVIAGKDAVIVEGDAPRSGGSRKYPSIGETTETIVVEMYDVPTTVIEAAKEKGYKIEVIEEQFAHGDK